MSKAFTLSQADDAMGAQKNFTAEVAATAAKAIQLVETAKQDKLDAISIMIPTTGWNTDSSEYPHFYDIEDSNVTSSDRADVTIATSGEAVEKFGFSGITETAAGYIRIRAKAVPTQVISAEYQIFGGK